VCFCVRLMGVVCGGMQGCYAVGAASVEAGSLIVVDEASLWGGDTSPCLERNSARSMCEVSNGWAQLRTQRSFPASAKYTVTQSGGDSIVCCYNIKI